MAPSSSTISLHGVGKIFASGVTALDGLDLDIRDGEFISLLGPSGCGKSTALRIIAGLSDPTHGTVTWPSGKSPHDQSIGFVFQEPTLMPWATVFDNVFLPLRLAGRRRTAAMPQVMKSLAQVGLSDFAQAYPRELSGGMKMRVSIARALVTDPTLLLMDEPFAALDEITRFKLNDDLIALWRALKVTVVFVTHSVFESVYLSQRVVVMTARPGRVAAALTIGADNRDAQFRTSPQYAGICRLASEALGRAMATPPGGAA
jgi:NitT/TauT family transport system ATP-binding protein